MLAGLFESLLVLLALIGVTFWLKNRSVLREQDSPTFTRIVTDLMLPALIFSNLATHRLTLEKVAPAAGMLGATLVALWAAWLIGRLFRLERQQLGAFVLVSGFGSSSSLGYTLISQVYPGDPAAVADAVIIGELGVAIPFFVIGVPIALHFGSGSVEAGEGRKAIEGFFRSPIFIALMLGIGVSLIGLPDNYLIDVLFRVFDAIGGAMMVIVAFAIGLMLKPIHIRNAWLLMLAVVGLKLLLEPFLAAESAAFFGAATQERDVLLIEAAMPSGTIAAVVSARYGCDGGFASAVVIVTFFAALASLPLLAYLLG
jgi:predicted permease